MQTHWKLAQTLERYGKTPAALARASGLSKTTVYAIVNDKSKAVELETLDKLLGGLEQMTGKKLGVDDLLERRSPRSSAWSQLEGLKPVTLEQLRSFIPQWNDADPLENERFVQALQESRDEDRRRSAERDRRQAELFPSDPETRLEDVS